MEQEMQKSEAQNSEVQQSEVQRIEVQQIERRLKRDIPGQIKGGSGFGAFALAFTAMFCFSLPGFADRVTVVPAREASKESFQVNKRFIWHKDLADARAEAASSGRLVFWVHMLGSMDGKT